MGLLVEGGEYEEWDKGEDEGQEEEEDEARVPFGGTEPSDQLSCLQNHSLKAST